MVNLQKHLLVLAVFLFHYVQSNKICDFKNIKCLTKAAQNNFKRMVSGIPNLMEPLETLHEDKITGKAMDLEYVLTNTTLYGIKNCEVDLLSLNTDRLEFEYNWKCPHLVLDTDFVAKGKLGNINIDHEGSVELGADDYIIKFKGTYGRIIDSKDQKLRVFIDTYDIDTEPKKQITFTYKTYKGDETIADLFAAYFNENWQKMEKALRSPTINTLLSHFLEQMKVFLKAFSVEENLSDLD